jgi:hypothetical protein
LQDPLDLGNILGISWRTRLRKILLSVAMGALFMLAACASTGFDPDAAARFKPGVTTRAEAIARLGAPASVYDGADETKTLTWAKDGGLFDSGSTKGLSIQFGPDDRMVRMVSQP